ncbi:hypothetical protein ACFX13_045636 [Malus domestica]
MFKSSHIQLIKRQNQIPSFGFESTCRKLPSSGFESTCRKLLLSGFESPSIIPWSGFELKSLRKVLVPGFKGMSLERTSWSLTRWERTQLVESELGGQRGIMGWRD